MNAGWGSQAAVLGVGPFFPVTESSYKSSKWGLSLPSPSHRLLLELKHSDIGPFSVSLRWLWLLPSHDFEITVPRPLGPWHHFRRPLVHLHTLCMYSNDGRNFMVERPELESLLLAYSLWALGQ